ncbi:MAG TPA: glycosyltransferase family 2 protein [Blastocatellia bacterium]|nr:glycosyltransferase family 2 protein [Blastocatellia bacterium]
MTTRPDVSVVMSVHNDANYLTDCIESVLSQTGVSFEFIAVDDGSTDRSGSILDAYASKDKRLRVIHQTNQGLTRALITGCSIANGEYLARQDSDDISFQGRLAKLAGHLASHDAAVLVASGAVMMGPNGELLVDGLPSPAVSGDLTFCHGSLMFRKSAYDSVGGYRRQFAAAQDVDLQLRLAELGKLDLVRDVLYAYRIREGSISSRSPVQKQLSRLAEAARDARRNGRDERPVLEEASRLGSAARQQPRSEPGTGNYFIGRCLYSRRDRRAMTYLWAACQTNPLSMRNWLALAEASMLTRSSVARDVTLRGIIPRQSA